MRRAWLAVLAATLLGACATPPSRPTVTERSLVDSAATTYRVRPGDTLYSIAWRHGLDYRTLARRNAIEPPYLIHPGQLLALSERKADARPTSSARTAPPRTTGTQRTWHWPASGRVVREFGDGNKGIDVEVTSGTSVVAAASGEVVYAASGLRGHQTLIIVKHDDAWLSAYGLNQPSRVAEGDLVAAGSALADLRGKGAAAALHFEIRRDGDPVDPRPLLASGRR